jgi:aldose sugar dehydrogenase
MRTAILASALFPATLALASCGADGTGHNPPGSTPSPAATIAAGEPVALPAENTNPAPFAITAHGTFAEPWALAFEPRTGRLFITEKAGGAKLVDLATGQATSVGGLPAVAYGGQGGMGDIAFAPDYASSRMIYLSWAEAGTGTARRAVAGRGRLDCAGGACTVSGLAVIWRQSPEIDSPGHFSHKITFSPDGRYLFIASGERMQGDPAQDLGNNLGKVVRLNLDGTPAAGNPFAARGGVSAEIWSYGHRNMYGLHFDANGQLWDLEHGPAGGDELNRVTAGTNYGWPLRSNGDHYDGVVIPDHSPDDGFGHPAISWNPVIAPGDFVFYRGTAFAGWQGNVIAANLGVGTLVRVAINADGQSAREVERWRFPRRLRDIAESADGGLWLIEDGPGGRLLRLVPNG